MDVKDLLPQLPEEKDEGAPHWMVTFADMSCLLLGFFILLVSFANQDLNKFRSLMDSVHRAFNAKAESAKQEINIPRSEDMYNEIMRQAEARIQVAPKEGSDRITLLEMKQANSIIQSVFQELNAQGVEVLEDGQGVTVRVEGQLLFAPGEAAVRQEGTPVIEMVGRLMSRYNFDLHILGHTDNQAIATARFPSNWELSGARASAVLRYLVERGADPKRLVAVGFADSRPLTDNATPESRAKNRRVEFQFRAPEANGGEALKPAQP